MENLSHSRLPNKGLPSLPKKACNGNTFNSGKANTYDDVFGGPPRFGASALSPRLEDYGEIFGGFNAPRGSSIPVLDLPLVHEDEVFSDVRSSGFDYGEVFGGFDSLDFASSYEELVMDQSKGGDGDSSEEAWTPVETESPLEGSDHSGKSPCLSNGDSLESIDGSMEFSVSYNKACQSEIGMSNGVTHVTESIPGYTFAVDKTTRLPKEYENPCLKVTDDSTLDNTGRMMKGRHLRKTKTLHSANGNTGGQTFEDDVTKRKMYSRNSSFPNSMFVTVSEVSLRTQPSELPPPSRPPPLLDARTEDACRFTSNSGTNATEGPAFASSPPFFDVEIDASSAAAVSAAAIKEAMEKAQAKIKSAKESMERKRESVKNNLKSGSKNGRKDKEGTLNKNVDGSDGIKEEIACGVRAQGDNGMNFYVRDERHKVIKSTQEVPGSIEVDKIFNVVRKSSEEKPEKKSLSPQQLNEIDENDEWKEATQFFELVRLDKSRASFEYENSEDILLHNTKFLHEDGQKEKWSTVRNSEKQPERKLKAVGENQTAEKLEKKSETAKVVCEHKDKYGKSRTSIEAPRQKKHEKKVKIVKDFHEEEGEKKSKIAPQPVGAEKKATSIDQSENTGTWKRFVKKTKSQLKQEMDSGKLEKIQVAFVEEDRKMVAALKDTEKRPQVVGTVDILFDEEYVKSGMVRRNLEFVESLSRDAYVAELLIQEQRVNRAGEAGSSIAQTDVEKTKDVSQLGSDLRNHNKKFAYELEGRGNHITQTQTILNQEENRDKSSSNETMRESVEGGKKVELTESSMLEGKRSTPKAAQQVNDRNARRKDRNLNEFSRLEEKESERIRRERELENERLRKIEEEREREREREKDRMAVDRLNAEVRDRAERLAVERVTAEARQRALAEARERLEKACAEAKEKSFGEKASVEARLRAERAAVERATAEARERAAEKAAFEARERMERSVSDKFSTSSRNSGMRPSSSFSDVHDHQFQTTGSLGAQRFHSAYGASYYGEKSEGVDGESAQRCKARLERHRRTAERAAKALAEKNMRDLIAQREQAERNRLAETLDADVKRWSSGKEGNLRALLSTLQYILGPDSGWQPIPLTEVITAPAVKKAYRKATLCVHPDKLQQRGASIQQKYICEKVFDLLKEAWNKFNSEER
ncbi:auxilin-related protein 1 [Carica papaya]|uniref:auxilin-related protein 1 n=1 Tax=Carica papaya TaxID=3649 RepID=UPI000B8C761B|nr:auxilin-related protein 1 [Carica papaya]